MLLCFREQPITANTFANAASLPALGQLAGPCACGQARQRAGGLAGKGAQGSSSAAQSPYTGLVTACLAVALRFVVSQLAICLFMAEKHGKETKGQ